MVGYFRAAASLVDLQVGGDDSGYVLEEPLAHATVTNTTLLGAAVNAGTAAALDSKVSPTTTTPYVVAPNGDVMVTETDGKLVNYNVATGGNGFVEDLGGATQIGFNSDGSFFELKDTGNFWALASGSPWVQVDSGVTAFQTDPNGALYELKSNGNFWLYTGPSSTTSNPVRWTLIASGVSSFLAMNGGMAPVSAETIARLYNYGFYNYISFNYYSSDGQIAYDAGGSIYLLYASLYNANGPFQVTDGGTYDPGIHFEEQVNGAGNTLDWSSVTESSPGPVFT